jgi:predicted molibdopterin-dependent oxidoreductase YjgC
LDEAHKLRFTFDGDALEAAEGETIAVALWAAGRCVLRTTPHLDEPRGLFCNMGVCFECLVEVDGHANLRACQTIVRADMQVRTQRGFGYKDVAPELGE